jgi:hypothetical protein
VIRELVEEGGVPVEGLTLCWRGGLREEEKGTDLEVRHYKHNKQLGEGDEGVGETQGMIARNWITVKVQYLDTYHSNETRES